jgi:H+/Cl- antiporter ClcA
MTQEVNQIDIPMMGTGSMLGKHKAAIMGTVDIGLHIEQTVEAAAAAVGGWAAVWRLVINVEDEEQER